MSQPDPVRPVDESWWVRAAEIRTGSRPDGTRQWVRVVPGAALAQVEEEHGELLLQYAEKDATLMDVRAELAQAEAEAGAWKRHYEVEKQANKQEQEALNAQLVFKTAELARERERAEGWADTAGHLKDDLVREREARQKAEKELNHARQDHLEHAATAAARICIAHQVDREVAEELRRVQLHLSAIAVTEMPPDTSRLLEAEAEQLRALTDRLDGSDE